MLEINNLSFDKRYKLAKTETENLLKKYNCNDYLKDGKFNNFRFTLKDFIISLKAENIVYKDIEDDITNLELEIKIDEKKKELFKKIYNINWKPIRELLNYSFYKDFENIENKYNIHTFDLYLSLIN